MVGEPQARGRDDFNKHGEKRDGTGGLGNVIFKAATLLAEVNVCLWKSARASFSPQELGLPKHLKMAHRDMKTGPKRPLL